MKTMIKKIRQRVSEEALYQGVKEISSFHRIQASTGYRKAALFLHEKLSELGIESRILRFPADGKSWFQCSRMFKEWDCRNAWLKNAATGEVLADYQADPISVIQRSYACDYRDRPLDLVLLDRGSKKEDYGDLDLRGKLVFYQAPFKDIHAWAVGEKGAVGIVTDCIYEIDGVRSRHDLYDIRNYTSFWWRHDGSDVECFGYVLSPRQGDRLAALCREQRRRHEEQPEQPAYPQMNCFMDASLYEGEMEVVEAFLAGTTEEELLLVAHLCHPRASANDNASGVSSVTEALRVLKNMSGDGSLKPLRRGVRAIFVPEFTGIYPWLESRGDQLGRIMAGLNLDMVGGKAGEGYGPLTLSGIPDSSASFVVSLAECVMDVLGQEFEAHSGMDYVASHPMATTEFDPGSDNYILCDPTVDIPTPMLGQWPDRHYHSSGDSLDKVDPALMKQSATLAASYIYLLSELDEGLAREILDKSLERFFLRLRKQYGKWLRKAEGQKPFLEGSRYLQEVFDRQNRGLLPFLAAGSDAYERCRAQIEQNAQAMAKIAEGLAQAFVAEEPAYGQEELPAADAAAPLPRHPLPSDEQLAQIWERRYRAPLSHIEDHFKARPERCEAYRRYEKEFRAQVPHAYRMEALIQFSLNGSDSLAEILEKLSRQSGLEKPVFAAMAQAYLEVLEKLELLVRKG